MNSLSLNNLKKKKNNCLCLLSRFSHIQLLVTLWTVALEAPLSIGFCRQEHWSGLSCPPPGDLPDTGIEPASPAASALQADSLPLSHQENPEVSLRTIFLKTFLLILIRSGRSNISITVWAAQAADFTFSALEVRSLELNRVGFWGGLSLCPLTLERLQ